jgi:hypothetical protein
LAEDGTEAGSRIDHYRMEQELEVGLISRGWNRSWEYIGLTFRAGTRSGEED